jgi:hypothetical protein
MTKGLSAPLWIPSTNRPPIGCRHGFRALNHDHVPSAEQSPERRIDMNRHLSFPYFL